VRTLAIFGTGTLTHLKLDKLIGGPRRRVSSWPERLDGGASQGAFRSDHDDARVLDVVLGLDVDGDERLLELPPQERRRSPRVG
jgi:hypothetical protein